MSKEDTEAGSGDRVDDVDQSQPSPGYNEGMEGEGMVRPGDMKELVLLVLDEYFPRRHRAERTLGIVNSQSRFQGSSSVHLPMHSLTHISLLHGEIRDDHPPCSLRQSQRIPPSLSNRHSAPSAW